MGEVPLYVDAGIEEQTLSVCFFWLVLFWYFHLSPQRALPTKTKVESGTSQSKSGTSVNLSNGGNWKRFDFTVSRLLAYRAFVRTAFCSFLLVLFRYLRMRELSNKKEQKATGFC